MLMELKFALKSACGQASGYWYWLFPETFLKLEFLTDNHCKPQKWGKLVVVAVADPGGRGGHGPPAL